MTPPKRDKPQAQPSGASPFSSPFAQLERLRQSLPEGAPAPAAQAPATKAPVARRAVVRYERKGRGGKEVTVIEQLDLPSAALAALLKQLKSALGCGGTLEDGALILQGDHRERARDFLVAQGVSKVSVG